MTGPALTCESAAEVLEARLDGVEPPPSLDAHLERCQACRTLACDLEAVRHALRSAPMLVLPAADLERVWDRTIRADRGRRSYTPPFWGAAAAAAMLAVLLVSLSREAPPPAALPDPEVRKARAELQFVFALADREMRRSGQTALHDVLGGEVAPALRRAGWNGETR